MEKEKSASDLRSSEGDSRAENHAPSVDDAKGTPKKRRKVNHGMLPSLCPVRVLRSCANPGAAFLQLACIAVDL